MILRFKELIKLDWGLIIVVLLLVLVGLLSIYGTQQEGGAKVFEKQLIYVILGFIFMFSIALIDYRIFRDSSFILVGLYVLGLVLLVGVLLVGKEIRGVSSWFRIGNLGFEPIEFMKLIIVLILAKYFSLRHVEISRLQNLIISGLYVFFPALLLLLQPELGYVLIISLIWLAIVIVAGIKLRYILFLVIIGIIIGSVGWFSVLHTYQKERVLSFFSPESDPLGRGYHIIQSVIAIGSGKFFGRGLGQGTQSQLNFLPEQHTDFIFATIAEEWGFVGVAAILILFWLLFYKLIKISISSTNNFARLASLGIALMLILETIINIGMTMGLLPIIGIPLPFISYGGSAMVMNFIALGIVQSIAARNKL